MRTSACRPKQFFSCDVWSNAASRCMLGLERIPGDVFDHLRERKNRKPTPTPASKKGRQIQIRKQKSIGREITRLRNGKASSSSSRQPMEHHHLPALFV